MKKTIILFFIISSVLTTFAKDAAKNAFFTAPQELIPYAPAMLRMDMADYYESGSDKKIKNSLFDASRIISLDENNIVIEETADSASIAQISVDINAKGDTTYIFIRNIATPAIDGCISFYDTEWKPLKGKCFEEPKLKDWVIGGKKSDIEAAQDVVPFVMCNYSYDTQTKFLTLEPSFDVYTPKSDFEEVKNLFYSKIVYRWDGKKMKLTDKVL